VVTIWRKLGANGLGLQASFNQKNHLNSTMAILTM